MLAYVISVLSNWLYTYILVALLLAAGLYFTLRTRFVQLRMFGESFRVLREEKHEEGGVSSFQALMISTASRVGTGNIAGVSIAICLGGVGAVFWMWLVALLGGASAFIESTLAQIYKVPDGNGGSRGGRPTILKRCWGAGALPAVLRVFDSHVHGGLQHGGVLQFNGLLFRLRLFLSRPDAYGGGRGAGGADRAVHHGRAAGGSAA